MSCFWDSIITKINHEIISDVLDIPKITPLDFCNGLKDKNCKTTSVLWNGGILTEQQYSENMAHIKDYDIGTISNGYDCSICDPFLLLITELFQIDIYNSFNNTTIHYKYNGETESKSFTLQNDKGHMW